jgi:hypothetical protein
MIRKDLDENEEEEEIHLTHCLDESEHIIFWHITWTIRYSV